MRSRDAKALQTAPLAAPTDLEPDAVRDVAGALNVLLADMIALYLKTKNFHWHVSGPHPLNKGGLQPMKSLRSPEAFDSHEAEERSDGKVTNEVTRCATCHHDGANITSPSRSIVVEQEREG